MNATTPQVADGFDRYLEAIEWWRRSHGSAGPTSSITGGGAIAELEAELAHCAGLAFAVALSSGSDALVIALELAGVGAGDKILIAGPRWLGDEVVLASTGATVVRHPTAGPPASWTVWVPPAEGVGPETASRRGERLIVDLSCTTAERWAGLCPPGAIAVVSFGPGKPISAGEGGAIIVPALNDYRQAVLASQHTVRQTLTTGTSEQVTCRRIHPVAAVTALHQIAMKPASCGSVAVDH